TADGLGACAVEGDCLRAGRIRAIICPSSRQVQCATHRTVKGYTAIDGQVAANREGVASGCGVSCCSVCSAEHQIAIICVRCSNLETGCAGNIVFKITVFSSC